MANVSSKSNIVIPLDCFLVDLDSLIALFIFLVLLTPCFVIGFLILNISPNVLLSKPIIELGLIPPSTSFTRSLKYLSYHLLRIKSQPSGILLCKPTDVSFLSIALSKAINL